MNTLGYAAQSADAPLAPFSFTRRDLRADDVAIDILYCGVCHSDLHTARNDWGGAVYPIVPGHEIVGRVTAVGPEVTRHQPGEIGNTGVVRRRPGSTFRCPSAMQSWAMIEVEPPREISGWLHRSRDRWPKDATATKT